MQFKVISALAFATLAAAGALPRDTNPGNTNPGPGKTSSGTGNGVTNPAKSNSGGTNQGTTKQNTNQNTNQGTSVNPPFPGNPLPTIDGSKCSSGHLRCCKSAELPTASDVAPHLPSGYSASSISGLVGLNCVALPFGAKPDTCSDKPVCCTDNSHGDNISLGCNHVNL